MGGLQGASPGQRRPELPGSRISQVPLQCQWQVCGSVASNQLEASLPNSVNIAVALSLVSICYCTKLGNTENTGMGYFWTVLLMPSATLTSKEISRG